MLKKALAWALGAVTVLLAATYTSFQISPWPSVLYHRYYSQIIDHSWFATWRATERQVPPRIAARLNEHYDTNDPDAVLDVYYPSEVENTDRSLPTIVWVHGGAFFAGSKDQIAYYLRFWQ